MRRITFTLIVPALLAANSHAGDKSGDKTSLFNGKDLSSWKAPDKQPEWMVKDGVIHYDGRKGAKNLATAKDYKDFEFWCEWKITKAGDSGIYLRGKPQVQIWDSSILEGSLKADRDKGSGGLWNNKPGSEGKEPLVNADKPIGEWNSMYVKMVGARVTVILNDKKVVDNALFLNGEIPAKGPIELQVHGTPLWFRNIYVRELKSEK